MSYLHWRQMEDHLGRKTVVMNINILLLFIAGVFFGIGIGMGWRKKK